MSNSNTPKNILHYRNKCIGCGACSLRQPELWEMSPEDGKANLIDSKDKKGIYCRKLSIDEVDDSRATADSCPVNIIKLD